MYPCPSKSHMLLTMCCGFIWHQTFDIKHRSYWYGTVWITAELLIRHSENTVWLDTYTACWGYIYGILNVSIVILLLIRHDGRTNSKCFIDTAYISVSIATILKIRHEKMWYFYLWIYGVIICTPIRQK